MQTGAPPGLRLQTPAKVNLCLRVLGTRPDGFHEIRSVVMAVGLFDDLGLTLAEEPRVRLSCDHPELPCDERNLVLRAAKALAERAEIRAGASIELHKRIPLAAGLGGGSSDAAATLLGLNKLWGAGLSRDELVRIGADVGSDVPLFLSLPAASIAGRGERVQPVDLGWSGWVLLVFGGWPVSTAEVYGAWRPTDGDATGAGRIEQVLQAAEAGAIMAASLNELEAAVFRVCPKVSDLHQQVSSVCDRPVRVCGAGSTLFTIFDDQVSARGAVAELTEMGLPTALVGGGGNLKITL